MYHRKTWTLEDELILRFRIYVLECFGWNKCRTAKFLNISVRNLRYFANIARQKGYYIGTSPTSTDRHHDPTEEELKTIKRWIEFKTPINMAEFEPMPLWKKWRIAYLKRLEKAAAI